MSGPCRWRHCEPSKRCEQPSQTITSHPKTLRITFPKPFGIRKRVVTHKNPATFTCYKLDRWTQPTVCISVPWRSILVLYLYVRIGVTNIMFPVDFCVRFIPLPWILHAQLMLLSFNFLLTNDDSCKLWRFSLPTLFHILYLLSRSSAQTFQTPPPPPSTLLKTTPVRINLDPGAKTLASKRQACCALVLP
jgi:hypothetical protein